MSPATLDDLLKPYAEIDDLITRAREAAQSGDRERAILLGFAVTQKLTTLDERLLEMGIMPEGELWPDRLHARVLAREKAPHP